jgi:ferrous iron transport protein A
VKNLDALDVGDSGIIQSVHGSDATTLRLMEMGLTPGAVFCFIGRAPLGDPIEIEVRGYRLSLRKSEAARVEITVSS